VGYRSQAFDPDRHDLSALDSELDGWLRFVIADVLHERAAGFYEHHGFRRIPGKLRLVQKVSDIAAAIDRL